MIRSVVLFLFLVIYLGQTALGLWLEYRNLRQLKKNSGEVPGTPHWALDAGMLGRSREYTLEKSRVEIWQSTVSDLAVLAAILSGFLSFLDHAVAEWTQAPLWAGLAFFALLALLSDLLGLPFDYVHTFVVEERYGFNRTDRRTWVVDRIKSVCLSLVVLLVLGAGVLIAVRTFPRTWWIWGFLFVSLVQFLLFVLYPVAIAPLFNRFESVQDEELARRIRELLERTGIRVGKVLQMDAGKRSRHTNAYFAGLGRTKRVVLFDTLLQSHPQEEILAVLAHEAGHYVQRHTLKQLLLFEGLLLGGFYVAYRLMGWNDAFAALGFEQAAPHVRLFVLGVFLSKVGFFIKPLYMALSRKFELEADRFAVQLAGSPEPMIRALGRLAADNLSNLVPDPLYVRFHYSHPPLLERIRRLQPRGG